MCEELLPDTERCSTVPSYIENISIDFRLC